MTDQDKKILLEQSRITEKQRMIDRVVKESNADQRLTIYKAELITEIEKLKTRADSSTYLYGQGQSQALDSVLDIIKKKQ